MSSADDQYLPELSKVLSGDAKVFSWYHTLRSLKAKRKRPELLVLHTSPKVRNILHKDIPTFPEPSSQSKSAFETKTSAIHVTPSAESGHDIAQIKDDAAWLSKRFKVAEDEALRISTLEWESMPQSRLEAGYSDAELASLRDVFGRQDDSQGDAVEQFYTLRSEEAFITQDERRKRLVRVLCCEEAGLIAVARQLLSLASVSSRIDIRDQELQHFAKDVSQQSSTNSNVKTILDNIELRLEKIATLSASEEDDELQINGLLIAAQCQNIRLLMEILMLKMHGPSLPTIEKEIVLQWFHIVQQSNFFSSLGFLSSDIVRQLQATAATVSIAVLDAASAIAAVTGSTAEIDPSVFYLDSDTVSEITQILLGAVEMSVVQAAPAALIWALVLDNIRQAASNAKDARESQHVQKAIDQGPQGSSPTLRRTSYSSLQQSIFEDILDHLTSHSPVTDVIGYLLRCSMEVSHAFDTMVELATFFNEPDHPIQELKLRILQESVLVAVACLGYNPDVLRIQFAILGPKREESSVDTADRFIEDDFLMNNIFAIAAGRFPYESLPFLRLCRLLVPAKIFDEQGVHYIMFRLRSLDSFTQSAIGAFALYNTVREDENLNLVSLETDTSMIGPLENKLLTYDTKTSVVGYIPAATVGEVISESVPPVIRWQHSFSGLTLIGSWLELHYLGQLQSILSPWESSDDVATEIVLILGSLVSSMSRNIAGTGNITERQALTDDLLAEASYGLRNGFDIATCIFEIMEQELQSFRRRPSNTFSTSLLTACIDFMSGLIQIKPEQFWTLFGNSSLLRSHGSSDFLYSIVTAVEVPSQDYPLLEASSVLYENLITAALPTSRSRSAGSNTAVYRGIAPQPQKQQAAILLSMTRSVFIIFQNVSSWSFRSSRQMRAIFTTASLGFSALLYYAYGVGDPSARQNLAFQSAAQYLESQLRSNAQDALEVTAMVSIILKLAQLNSMQELLDIEAPMLSLTPLLSLAHRLIRLGKIQGSEVSLLELQLFDAIPVLVRHLSRDDTELLQVSQLITDLLPAVQTSRTISLLGHLGSTSSWCLLEVLKAQQQHCLDPRTQAALWKLMANLVGQKQQWLALVILTGSPPEKKGVETKGRSQQAILRRGSTIIDLAITRLTKIDSMSAQVAVATLDFVIQAQQNWSWTTTALKREKDFLPALMNYVRDTFVDTSSPLKVSYRNKIAALVTDLSTTHLHYARATQQKDIIKTLMSLLFVFAENDHVIKIDGYNTSLHANLKRNFANKFPGLDITDFKRTQLLDEDYGDSYYYDLSLAGLVLHFDPHWNAANHRREQSFAAELQRANLNLSVTESEIALFRSAKHFCVEHCGYFVVQDGPQKGAIKPRDLYPSQTILDSIASIARNCLGANSNEYPVQKLFETLYQSRIDVAIALLQKLVDVRAKGFEIKGLLKQAWSCAKSGNSSYEQAITNNDLIYWRSTLKVVLLTLQFHSGGIWSPPAFNHETADMLRQELTNITPVVLEVMTVVIGDGFRTIVAAIQEQRQSSEPLIEDSSVTLGDLSLVLSLLNTMLRITRAPEYVSDGAGRLISSGIIPNCCLLYSWSHTLVDKEYGNNPIYADIAIQFLSALSTLPPVAEEMGVEGVLSRLLSGRTTQKLQNIPEGAGHLDPRPNCRFLYGLWASGLLPVCLNLLHSMGPPIAAEISIFLNQFPQQLMRASSAFVAAAQSKNGGSNAVTYVVAREAATLALISFMLESYRQAGASAAIDPTMIIPLAGYDEHKKALADDISDILTSGMSGRVVAISEEDAEWAKKREGTATLLEKKTLRELKDALICLRGQEIDDEDSSPRK